MFKICRELSALELLWKYKYTYTKETEQIKIKNLSFLINYIDLRKINEKGKGKHKTYKNENNSRT